MVIEGDNSGEPPGIRQCADKDKQRSGVDLKPTSGPVILGDNGLESVVTVRLTDLRAQMDGDSRVCADLVDQVPRHGFAQIIAADDQVHRVTSRREEDGRLASRIPASPTHDGAGPAQQCLLMSGCVIHTVALKPLNPGYRKHPISGSDSKHNRTAAKAGVLR